VYNEKQKDTHSMLPYSRLRNSHDYILEFIWGCFNTPC